MTRLLAVAIVVVCLQGHAAANADDDGSSVNPGLSGFVIHGTASTTGTSTAPSSHQAEIARVPLQTPVCALGGDQTCAETAMCDNGEPMLETTFITASGQVIDGGTNCPVDAAPPAAAPVVTPGLVLAAFRRLPLPASELSVQPPGGRTLVNFETNFFTDDGQLTRTVTLLGQRVELRIWPAQFGWRFGDGESQWTASPGAAYPDLEITHRYLRTGTVAPSVDTTYAARFRVNGGPWRDVAGTVTIPGSAQALQVVTARPVLVGF